MRMLGRGFHTLIKNDSFSSPFVVGSHNPHPFGAQCPRWHSFPSPIDVGLPNPPPSGPSVLAGTLSCVYPFRGSASSLIHRLMSGSDTICNRPSPPLADIVFFELFLSGFPPRFLKRLVGRGFHTLIKNDSFSSPTDVGSHNPISFGVQRPCWHTALCPSPFRTQPPRWHIARW